MKTKIKQSINFYYYISYLFYLCPIIFLIGSTDTIINNSSINRIDLILHYTVILILTGGLSALINVIIKESKKA